MHMYDILHYVHFLTRKSCLHCKCLVFFPGQGSCISSCLIHSAWTEFPGPGQLCLRHTVAISTFFAFRYIQNPKWWGSDHCPRQGKLLISYPKRVPLWSKDSNIKPTWQKHFILCVRRSFCSWRWLFPQWICFRCVNRYFTPMVNRYIAKLCICILKKNDVQRGQQCIYCVSQALWVCLYSVRGS